MQSFGTLIDATLVSRAIKAAMLAYQAYKAYKAAESEYAIKYFRESKHTMDAALGREATQGEHSIGTVADIIQGKNPQEAVQSVLSWGGLEQMPVSAGKAYLLNMAVDFATDLAFKAFFGGCTAQDDLTRCFVKNGLCHYVGSYCKKSWPGVGCVQRAKVYCCFNSKLARIVHEQGRPQLKNFAGSRKNMWGDPEDSPKCRGFTPQEFQMLDFSRIDLSEWYADINAKAKETIQNRLNQNVTNFINNLER
jgi:conjugal transfer mating pair stabilization protein TraN